MIESRTKKSLLNAKVNFLFYALTLVLTFFSRKIFFDCLGVEFIGFTSTLQNLLGFLNLAELGIGVAIAYVLYRPLFDADHEKISEIISILGYLYRGIGLFILAGGIVLSLFLPLIFPDTEFGLQLVYVAYYSFLASSLIGYFINYRQNLLAADQRNYVVKGYFQGGNILKTLIQMGLAYYTGSYYLWIAIELVFGIAYSFILNRKINQVYPWLKTNRQQGRALLKKYPQVIRYTKQIIFHRMAGVALYQVSPLLIYAFSSLSVVALYSNYIVITGKLSALLEAIMDGTGAGVGNLIAEGNISKITSVFWELTTIRYFIGAVFAFCLFYLADPFISLWLGHEYLLDREVLLIICISTFIGYSRGAITQFLNGYGLYWDVWAPLVELAINIGVACLCGYYWGLPGVLLGGVVSQLIIVKMWKPCFLYYCGFKKSIWNYVLRLGRMYIAILLPMLFVRYLIDYYVSIDPASSFFSWGIYACILSMSYSLLTLLTMFFCIPEFRNIIHRLLHLRILTGN